jgi:hypothetical protein
MFEMLASLVVLSITMPIKHVVQCIRGTYLLNLTLANVYICSPTCSMTLIIDLVISSLQNEHVCHYFYYAL